MFYYQGLHDITSVLLFTGGERLALLMMRRLVTCHLRDCTRCAAAARVASCASWLCGMFADCNICYASRRNERCRHAIEEVFASHYELYTASRPLRRRKYAKPLH